MSYVKITDYAAKDALLTGNAGKAILGTQLGNDFDAVATASAASDAAIALRALKGANSDITSLSAVTNIASNAIVIDGNSVVTHSKSKATIYDWTTWSPSDVAGTLTNASATGTFIGDTNLVSSNNVAGTLTLTFKKAGNYLITLNGRTIQTAAFTFDRMIFNLGGTATLSNASYPTPTNSAVAAYNMAFSNTFMIVATANQTLTILPTYELIGTAPAGSHAAYATVTSLYCGG
jgi:hypothetical protein